MGARPYSWPAQFRPPNLLGTTDAKFRRPTPSAGTAEPTPLPRSFDASRHRCRNRSRSRPDWTYQNRRRRTQQGECGAARLGIAHLPSLWRSQFLGLNLLFPLWILSTIAGSEGAGTSASGLGHASTRSTNRRVYAANGAAPPRSPTICRRSQRPHV